MSNWDQMLKQDIPEKQKNEDEFDQNYLHWELLNAQWDWNVFDHNADKVSAWNVEKQRLYKILGIRVLRKRKETNSGSYKTGEVQVTRTATNTYTVSEKTGHYSTTDIYYTIGIDKSKIKDIEKYMELKKRVDEFLKDAEKKFGYDEKSKIARIPSFFDTKERLHIVWKQELLHLLVTACTIFFFIPCLINKIKLHTNFNKDNAEYLPLVNAYFEQVAEFESEAKQIVCID